MTRTQKKTSPHGKQANAQTLNDLKSAALVVSILFNAFILTGWIALQVTNQYNDQVATFLHLQ